MTNGLATAPLTMAWRYDLAGNRTQITWPDGFVVDYAYDYLNRVTQIAEAGATSGPGVLASYVYDGVGRRTQVGRAGSTVASTLTSFDAAGRLMALTQRLAGTGNDVASTFAYSPGNQAVSDTISNPSYVYHPGPLNGIYTANGLEQAAPVDAAPSRLGRLDIRPLAGLVRPVRPGPPPPRAGSARGRRGSGWRSLAIRRRRKWWTSG